MSTSMRPHLTMIGLGKMGSNMVRRLLRAGLSCSVMDVNPKSVEALVKEGAEAVSSLDEIFDHFPSPRIVWMMLPAGEITEEIVLKLNMKVQAGDIVIDGGNSHYLDDLRRSEEFRLKKAHYLDVGVSGGVWGLERGYCLMAGGNRDAVKLCEPFFQALAQPQGYLYCGPSGAGHFVKMVHNGIEYGMMQALAEGFDLLEKAPGARLDLAAIAELWRHGSVISSWLLDLVARALASDPKLEAYQGKVADSGEARWMLEAALREEVPLDVIASSLFRRFRSRQDHPFAEKLLSAMRHEFGGHVEVKSA